MRTFRIKAINNIPKKERRTLTRDLIKGKGYRLYIEKNIRHGFNLFNPKPPYKQNKKKGKR